MSHHPEPPFADEPPVRRQAISVPAVIVALIASFALVHAVRSYGLSGFGDAWVLVNFAFVPGCYGTTADICGLRESWAPWVSPLSHAFLHGDWTHFGANAVWLLAFGTPVARRLGTGRLLLFSALGAVAGAGLFFLLNRDLVQPMIGASGVVSALMGGAARFALGATGRGGMADVARAPLLSIRDSLSDRTTLFFIVIFFVTNVALGSGAAALFGEGGAIAWEAHLGGFLFGFLCFSAFEPRRPASSSALRGPLRP